MNKIEYRYIRVWPYGVMGGDAGCRVYRVPITEFVLASETLGVDRIARTEPGYAEEVETPGGYAHPWDQPF